MALSLQWSASTGCWEYPRVCVQIVTDLSRELCLIRYTEGDFSGKLNPRQLGCLGEGELERMTIEREREDRKREREREEREGELSRENGCTDSFSAASPQDYESRVGGSAEFSFPDSCIPRRGLLASRAGPIPCVSRAPCSPPSGPTSAPRRVVERAGLRDPAVGVARLRLPAVGLRRALSPQAHFWLASLFWLGNPVC